jgi:hypothetical protein
VYRWILRELLGPTYKISVDMGLCHGCYAQTVVLSQGEVSIDIALWIDNKRLATTRTPNKVRILSKLRIKDLA